MSYFYMKESEIQIRHIEAIFLIESNFSFGKEFFGHFYIPDQATILKSLVATMDKWEIESLVETTGLSREEIIDKIDVDGQVFGTALDFLRVEIKELLELVRSRQKKKKAPLYAHPCSMGEYFCNPYRKAYRY